MTQRKKSYFFSSVLGSMGRLFRTGNRPNETAFKDLFDSVPFKSDSDDTATESNAGHVKLASNDNVFDREDISSGHSKVVRPGSLPAVDLENLAGDTDEDGNAYDHGDYDPTSKKVDGLELVLVRRSGLFRKYRAYIVKHLADSETFEYDRTTKELKISAEGITNAMLAGSIAVTKIASMGKGKIMVGTASGNTSLELGTNGQFLIADTTETSGLKAVVMSSDATMDKDGVVTIANGAITLAKMSSLAEGRIIVGPSGGGTPVALDLSGSAKFIIGQGNSVAAYALSGVISVAADGVVSYSDGLLRARHLHSTVAGNGLATSGSGDSMVLVVDPKNSLEINLGKVQLTNDAVAPGNDKYYGTNGSGTRAWLGNAYVRGASNDIAESSSQLSGNSQSVATGIGGYSWLNGLVGRGTFNHLFGKRGSSQKIEFLMGANTEDAAKTECTINNDGTSYFVIPEDCSVSLEVLCIGVQTGGSAGDVGDVYTRKAIVVAKNVGGVSVLVHEEDILEDFGSSFPTGSGLDINVVDLTNKLEFHVTGDTDIDVDWLISVSGIMIGFEDFDLEA